LIYGEIFVNEESLSARTVEIKSILLEGYKKFFSQEDIFKKTDKKNEFTQAVLGLLNKNASGTISTGITPDNLVMLRTRFILDWKESNATKFPHKLFEYHQLLLQQGLFEAYNQWLFGTIDNLAAYETWTKTHTEAYEAFNKFRSSRVFKIPNGQYYQSK
jgi:hypothetical protein